jgi:hypothetical protein
MARRRLAIKRGDNARLGSAKLADARLRQALEAIETERDNLSCAQSLLDCMKLAMEYAEVNHKGPYYPDLAQMASDIVRKSINALDPINLPRPSRDKVREEFLASDSALLLVAQAEMPQLQRRVCTPLPRCALRIHRRNYSRESMRSASRLDSASANISACVAR